MRYWAIAFVILFISGCGQKTTTPPATTTPTRTLSTLEASKVAKAVCSTFQVDDLLTREASALAVSSLPMRAQEITLLTREVSGDWMGWWHIKVLETEESESMDLDAHARIWIETAPGNIWEITQEADFQYVDIDYDPTDEIPYNLRKIWLAGNLVTASIPAGAWRDEIVAGAPGGRLGGSLVYVSIENETVGTREMIAVSGMVLLNWQEAGEEYINSTRVIFDHALIDLDTGYPAAGAPATWDFTPGIVPVPIMSGDIYFTGGKYAMLRITAQGGNWTPYYYRINLDNGDVEYISGPYNP